MAYSSWSDAVYFSTNAVWDAQDKSLRTRTRSQGLAPGFSYQVTNTVTIPANAPSSYYLIVKSDYQDSLFESDETNNDGNTVARLAVRHPDLVPGIEAEPLAVLSGQTVSVSIHPP